ncbi:MAG: flagellin [Phycisphaeraceae bacterium]
MSRINTNVNSLLSQRVLTQQNKSLNTSLERLSTGLRINRGADDPAGLIASENLRSEKASISAAISNAERADQVVNIAEGGLQEINALLLEVQSLVGQSANDAGLSREEREANQLQVDSILQTIDRIASSTSFQGTKLLNGTYDFNVEDQASEVEAFKINAAKLGHDESRDVQVLVTKSAQHAGLHMDFGSTSLDFGSNADNRFVVEIGGADGSRQFTFASGTATSAMAAQINTYKDVIGVSAAVNSNGLDLKSTGYGSHEFVSVDIVDDGGQAGDIYSFEAADANTVDASLTDFASATNAVRDEGQDVGAIVNGVAATARGNVLRINTDFLDVEMELSDSGATNLATIDAFTVTGGGAQFNLGPSVDITNQVSVGIGNVAARNLGNITEGFLDALGSSKDGNVVDGDLAKAQRIVDESIAQVSAMRGRLGAFQKNIVGATIRSLGVALENTSAAESAIRDTDFAAETAEMTRSQILVNAATNVLGIANSQPQSVLQLLG